MRLLLFHRGNRWTVITFPLSPAFPLANPIVQPRSSGYHHPDRSRRNRAASKRASTHRSMSLVTSYRVDSPRVPGPKRPLRRRRYYTEYPITRGSSRMALAPVRVRVRVFRARMRMPSNLHFTQRTDHVHPSPNSMRNRKPSLHLSLSLALHARHRMRSGRPVEKSLKPSRCRHAVESIFRLPLYEFANHSNHPPS